MNGFNIWDHVGGSLVDGVDISAFSSTYLSHDHSAGNPTQVGHDDLLNLNWAAAGHTIDATVDFNNNQLTNCGNISMTGAATVDGVDVSAISLSNMPTTPSGDININNQDFINLSNVYTKAEINSTTPGTSGSELVGLPSLDMTPATVRTFIDTVGSSLYYIGGIITENASLNGRIDISEVSGAIKLTTTDDTMSSFTVSAEGNIPLVGGINYICVDLDGDGEDDPGFTIIQSEPNHSTVFALGRAYLDDHNHVHIMQGGHDFTDMPWKVQKRFLKVDGLVRADGMVTTEDGVMNLAPDITKGTFFKGINAFTFPAYDGGSTHLITGDGTVTANNTIRFDTGEGDFTSDLCHGCLIVIMASSSGNDGAYHVQSFSFAAGATTIVIEEASLNTGADTGHIHDQVFSYWNYSVDAGWVQETSATPPREAAVIIDNTYWNDITKNSGSQFDTFTSKRYGIAWVYASVDGDVHVVYGQGDYTLAQATAEGPPASLPDIINEMCFLIAKIKFQEGASDFYSVVYPWVTTFTATGASDHSGLVNLAWTSSAHTGTVSTFAGFDGSGDAAEYTEANYLLAAGTRTGASSQAQTFTNGVIIGDGATIGSASVTDVMTIDSGGNCTFSVFPLTPSEAPDADYEVANKKYVDDQVATANEFTELTDTPANYDGSGLNGVRVNTGASALEFYTVYADADAVSAVEAANPLDLANTLQVNTINEHTGEAGVTIETVEIKDGNVDGVDVSGIAAFTTISCPAGTNPVAAGLTDTLALTAGDGITITGNSTTDTVDIACTITQFTGADAITAVEGEATLALSGAVEITGILTVDEINEKTGGDAGVLIDGVDVSAIVAFKTINCPAGTNPVADSLTDTLNFTAGAGIAVTGTEGTDTVDIACTITQFTGANAITAVEGEATLALSGAVEVTGILTVDTINEKTTDNGVDIEGVHFEDSVITSVDELAVDNININGSIIKNTAAAPIQLFGNNQVVAGIGITTSADNRPLIDVIGSGLLRVRTTNANTTTQLQIMPSGTGVGSYFLAYSSDFLSDDTDFAAARFGHTGTNAQIIATEGGTGTAGDVQLFGQNQAVYGWGAGKGTLNAPLLSFIGSGNAYMRPAAANTEGGLRVTGHGAAKSASIRVYGNDPYSTADVGWGAMWHDGSKLLIYTHKGGEGVSGNIRLGNETDNYIELYDAGDTRWVKARIHNGAWEITEVV